MRPDGLPTPGFPISGIAPGGWILPVRRGSGFHREAAVHRICFRLLRATRHAAVVDRRQKRARMPVKGRNLQPPTLLTSRTAPRAALVAIAA
jgi:hypothetical protein